MATPQLTELEIVAVRTVKETTKGNCYVECDTNQGVVAVWGKSANMANINTVQSKTPPFKALCGCIPSNWNQHSLWVPETATLRLI